MANEYKLPYKGEEIVARLRKIDELATEKYVDQAIPKKLSELDNDEGYLKSFTETDPTVPSWVEITEDECRDILQNNLLLNG